MLGDAGMQTAISGINIFRSNSSRSLICLVLLAACEAYGAEPTNCLWSLKGESSGMLFLGGIAPDRESNCYVHGVLRGKGSLNGQSVPEETAGLPGFLAKLAPDGTVIWFKRLGFSTAMSSGLTVDADANVIVAGSFAESAKMGEETLRARGLIATVIAKFNPKGAGEYDVPYRYF